MFNRTKSMLGHLKEIQRKTDGFLRLDSESTYFDKHNLDSAGEPTKKPFIPGSLRIPPLLNCSKLVKDDKCMSEIYAETRKSLYIGNITQLDAFKTQQAIEAKKITELEVRVCKKLCACDYYHVAVEIAGSLLIIAKLEKRFRTPKSKTIDLS